MHLVIIHSFKQIDSEFLYSIKWLLHQEGGTL